MAKDDISLSYESKNMENMEIDVNAINAALMPELPEDLHIFLASVPDKVY